MCHIATGSGQQNSSVYHAIAGSRWQRNPSDTTTLQGAVCCGIWQYVATLQDAMGSEILQYTA